MILLDVNLLVAAHRVDADQHREIKSWLEAALSDPAGLAVSELALSGCLRVITHPKIFKKPTPLARAVDFVEDFRSGEEVHLLGPGTGHWKIFVDPLSAKRRARQSCARRVPRCASDRA
jgi:toxin-antitoxin system PIN domain toxin